MLSPAGSSAGTLENAIATCSLGLKDKGEINPSGSLATEEPVHNWRAAHEGFHLPGTLHNL